MNIRDVLFAIAGFVAAVILLVVVSVSVAVVIAGWLPVQYFYAMGGRIGADSDYAEDNILTAGRHVDHERALVHYFLGPVLVDFARIAGAAKERQMQTLEPFWSYATERREDSGSLIEFAVGAGVTIGAVIGTIGGVAVTVVIALMHAAIAINPNALKDAEQLDRERAQGKEHEHRGRHEHDEQHQG